MVHDYEEDRTKRNPYEAVIVGKCFMPKLKES
jgi:hypothetical protein